MLPRFGLPLLVDPRLNNATRSFGLSEYKKAEYLTTLHTMHYQWYLGKRDRDLAILVELHNNKIIAAEILANKAAAATVENARALAAMVPAEGDLTEDEGDDHDDGCDPEPEFSDPEPENVFSRPPSPTLPLMDEQDFLELSGRQYTNYRLHCKKIDWKLVCVDVAGKYDPKYQVGKKNTTWRELLWDVPLDKVWKDIGEVPDAHSKFGFSPVMATQSAASISSLPASSFCERINSAGKIVMNSRTIQMLPQKLEQRVLLRMNRKWISHMKQWYPECTGDVMCLLLEAHTALQGNGADSYFGPAAAADNHLNFAPEHPPAAAEANPARQPHAPFS